MEFEKKQKIETEISELIDDWKSQMRREREVVCKTGESVDGAYQVQEFHLGELKKNMTEKFASLGANE